MVKRRKVEESYKPKKFDKILETGMGIDGNFEAYYDEEEDIVKIIIWFPTPMREHLSGRRTEFYLEKEEIEDFYFFMQGVYEETR